jgi:hypothetical protein
MKSKIILDLDEINSHNKIVVRANTSQLNTIKKIVPSLLNKSIVKISDELYELSFKHIKTSVPKLFDAISLHDMLDKEVVMEKVIDFENSVIFYKRSEAKKQFKIIDDEFSQSRNRRLYKGFNLIEAMIRRLLSEKELSAILPQNYQSKSPDHPISQYSLGEIIEYYLLQPASDNYIVKEWNTSSKSDEDLLEITKLKMIDELDIPLTSDQLSYIRNTRNKCMHFRVITIAEYAIAVESLNKYIKIHSIKEFSSTIKEINTKLVTNISESFNGFANPFSNESP